MVTVTIFDTRIKWLLLAMLAWALSAHAQDYPAKPIRLVVATAPGGLMDVPAHLLADYLAKTYGQRMVVENKGGAGGVLAGDTVAKAAPDGYTLGLIQVGTVAINPFIVKHMPFDPLTDLAPIAPLTRSPVVVAVRASVPAKSLRELIELAKREPGTLNYGTAGRGTIPHLSGELFSQLAGVRLTAVHYRGAGPALADLLAGQVQMIFVGLGVVRSQAAAGKLRVLAVSQDTRLAEEPDVPTAAEAGLPGFEINTWFGVVGPRGTPGPVIALLSNEIHAMLDDPAVRARLSAGGLQPLRESPQEFAARMRRDHERFAGIIRKAGLEAR